MGSVGVENRGEGGVIADGMVVCSRWEGGEYVDVGFMMVEMTVSECILDSRLQFPLCTGE